MKKITALMVSVIMACGILSGCGDSDSSSKSDASSKAKKGSTASSAAAEPDSDKHLAEVYTEALDNKHFSLKMTATSDFTGETPLVLEVCGDDVHYEMSMLGFNIVAYKIGDTAYVLDAASKSYAKDESGDLSEGMMDDNMTMGVTDAYTFVSSENADGFIVETYNVKNEWQVNDASGVEVVVDSDDDDSSSDTVIKYYFDENTKDLVKIETTAMGMTSTTTIDSFDPEISEIKLPDDFDTWTEVSPDEFTQLLQGGMGDMSGLVDMDDLGDAGEDAGFDADVDDGDDDL